MRYKGPTWCGDCHGERMSRNSGICPVKHVCAAPSQHCCHVSSDDTVSQTFTRNTTSRSPLTYILTLSQAGRMVGKVKTQARVQMVELLRFYYIRVSQNIICSDVNCVHIYVGVIRFNDVDSYNCYINLEWGRTVFCHSIRCWSNSTTWLKSIPWHSPLSRLSLSRSEFQSVGWGGRWLQNHVTQSYFHPHSSHLPMLKLCWYMNEWRL